MNSFGERRSRDRNTPGSDPETFVIGVHPRDDVPWPDDGMTRTGVAEVRLDEDTEARGRLELGEPIVLTPGFPVGSHFAVTLRATYGDDEFAETFGFRVTGVEEDVATVIVGPGTERQRGRWGHSTVSGFEFGVTVMGAAREQDRD